MFPKHRQAHGFHSKETVPWIYDADVVQSVGKLANKTALTPKGKQNQRRLLVTHPKKLLQMLARSRFQRFFCSDV